MGRFYSYEELKELGFREFGKNVRVSKSAVIPNPEKITIGSEVLIDDFVLLIGTILINSYVHISAYCSLGGRFGIVLSDFVALAPGVRIFSATDDYSGEHLVGPCVPDEYRGVWGGGVILNKHVVIGANSVIFPSVECGLGSAVGAMSLVKHDIPPFKLYGGVPAKELADRSRNCLELEKKLCES